MKCNNFISVTKIISTIVVLCNKTYFSLSIWEMKVRLLPLMGAKSHDPSIREIIVMKAAAH